MIEKLNLLAARFKEVEEALSLPEVMKDLQRYKELMQEHAYLGEIVGEYGELQKIQGEIAETSGLAEAETDPGMREMIREELRRLEQAAIARTEKLKALLIPKDPLNEKDIIMEIRAGTGGDEAALFAADLYRMYCRYAEIKRWTLELINVSEIGLGGFKEIVFSIHGKAVYENLRYESGVHRVQRIPATESQGRLHTSAVTVAVLPEAEETDIEIRPEDIKVDVFRSSGPGGQSVNTTDSAVRITHLPTGMVVICQDEKSQIKNKAKALRVLKARLFEAEEAKKNALRAEARKTQVGSGDRSERIRTYNFPQNRLTDHRINLTLYKLDQIIQGSLDEVLEALKLSVQEQLLKEQ
ncbi:MAG: peptide chain release factor 1 [Spirochaetales bacterium]|jgi:peptide chain release factor 1|nr:peptide chain release factor 1 [Spirochaetales bacterium]